MVFSWKTAVSACVFCAIAAFLAGRLSVAPLRSWHPSGASGAEGLQAHTAPADQARASDRVVAAMRERQRATISAPQRDEATTPSPLEPTQDDFAEALRLSELRRKGIAVLDFEDPVLFKAHLKSQSGLRDMLEQQRAQDGHREMLSRLGLSAEEIARLDGHASKIAIASLSAEGTLQQLGTAREEYLKQLRKTLGDEKFSEYQKFEMGLRSQGDVTAFREFLGRNGLALSDKDADVVRALITETGAQTVSGWHGPFDTGPQVKTGFEDVMGGLEGDIFRSEKRRADLLAHAGKSALPQSLIPQLRAYCDQRIGEKQKELAQVVQARIQGPPRK